MNRQTSVAHAVKGTAAQNVLMMHCLQRVAERFASAEIPLMALKGAALNLTLYKRPEERPMSDLDLLVRQKHVVQACTLLERMGGLRGETLVREDFFPRFHYETEYRLGHIRPVKIDLHVRPLRPLRYSAWVPEDAFWAEAEPVAIGRATLLVPSSERMLIHLAAHAAVHGWSRRLWIDDLYGFVQAHPATLDWDRFLDLVSAWRLALPVRRSLAAMVRQYGPAVPTEVSRHLGRMKVGWRDRLALWQAPRDADHPVAHVLTNALCTPNRRFVFAYLRAVLIPDREHMGEWYSRRHRAWLPCAHGVRWLWPLVKHIPKLWSRFTRIEVRPSARHGLGVFGVRDFAVGEVIARYRGIVVDRPGPYVGWCEHEGESTRHFEITGRLKFLNHSRRPNAELSRFELVAKRPIRRGEELTICYGDEDCQCVQKPAQAPTRPAIADQDRPVAQRRTRPRRENRLVVSASSCIVAILLGMMKAPPPATAQSVYVSDNWSFTESDFYAFDADSGAFQGEVFDPGSFPSPNIRGAAFDVMGNLYMADQTRLRKRAPDGTLSVFVEDPALTFLDVTVGPDGLVWTTYRENSSQQGGLRKYNAGANPLGDYRNWSHAPANQVQPRSLIVGPDGRIYVADRSVPAGTTNAVVRFDPALGAFTTFSTAVPRPIGLAFHEDGDLLVSSDESFTIEKLDGNTGILTGTFVGAAADFEPAGIIYVNGRLYVADRDFGGDGYLSMFDSTGLLLGRYAPPADPYFNPIDLAMIPPPPPLVPGDMNCDGFWNGLDIAPFVLALLAPAQYVADYPSCNIYNGDINLDLSVDTTDIQPFSDMLVAL